MQEYFNIADGRTHFYQWDIDREMVVLDERITQLHFCNGTSDCSLVCEVVNGRANVPNILLQTAGNIRIYGYSDGHTEVCKIICVVPRTKPDDYVYTETEVLEWRSLEGRIEALENGAGGGSAIIDVAVLPDDGKADVLYRVPRVDVVAGGTLVPSVPCHVVDVLPEKGVMGNLYYQFSTGEAFGWVQDATGWMTIEAAISAMGGGAFGGYIYSIDDAPDEYGKAYLLLSCTLYQRNGTKWISMEAPAPVGWKGSGANAEIHNTTNNIASGFNAFAEGEYTKATGTASHAEGGGTEARGVRSHAEGLSTVAVGAGQHVQGEYNIIDKEPIMASWRATYAHIVGNGKSNARSNAHTLDWDGNAWFAGAVKVGGTGQDDETAQELATKGYVESYIEQTILGGAW